MHVSTTEKENKGRNVVDGVFDLFHSGHVNIFTNAKAVSDELVVVVCQDGILEAKGMDPIYTSEERVRLVRAVASVDEVLEGFPYDWSIDLIDWSRINKLLHGSDAITCEIYKKLKEQGRYKSIPRTNGISTSALIYRLLDAALIVSREKVLADRFLQTIKEPSSVQEHNRERNLELITYLRKQGLRDSDDNDWGRLPKDPQQSVVSMTRLGALPRRERRDNDTVVYIDGCFDVIHPGHLDLLAEAREMGTYVIVGLFDDHTIQQIRGDSFPVLSMMERAAILAGFKYVDDIYFGVPWMLESAFLDCVKPDIIIKREAMQLNDFLIPIRSELNYTSNDPYGMVEDSIKVVTVPMHMTIEDVLTRVLNRKEEILKFIDNRLVNNLNVTILKK